jgi:hypothetical protein
MADILEVPERKQSLPVWRLSLIMGLTVLVMLYAV